MTHRGDEPLLILTEYGTPLLFRLQIHKVLGVEKSCSVGSVIRPPHLTGALGDFWKRTQQRPRAIRQGDAFGLAGARRKSAAYPDGAFIQMRQELRTDNLHGQEDS